MISRRSFKGNVFYAKVKDIYGNRNLSIFTNYIVFLFDINLKETFYYLAPNKTMPTDTITYQDSGYFSKLIVAYLNQSPDVNSYYNHYPELANFKKQIDEKTNSFSDAQRKVLVEALKQQYEKFDLSSKTIHNIQLLEQENTFTVTTGHQLNLFTGPLYFIYKIVSTINLCKLLKQEYPDYNFVPVYWMATEDHDFAEINHFQCKGEKLKWDFPTSGPVGRLKTKGMDEVFQVFKNALGVGNNAQYLAQLFEKSYLQQETLTDATRFLVNELFKETDLVIIDGDDKQLKTLFKPFLKKELTSQLSYQKVSETIHDFPYDVQVNPREINLFYMETALRERIVLENKKYKVLNTSLEFTKEEILNLVEASPEKFSPNVILRPLYQEVILPNLCYIGGGGEIAYWLELKAMFEAFEVPFPMLLLRNSVVIANKKQYEKADKLDLSWGDLFLKSTDLINKKTKELSQFTIDFSEQKEFLKKQFERLKEIALQTDNSFIGAVQAQEAKQLKGLDNLEKRLLKAEKRILKDKLERITQLQDSLFPKNSLQERQLNFAEFYLEYGDAFLEQLFLKLTPLEHTFDVLLMR